MMIDTDLTLPATCPCCPTGITEAICERIFGGESLDDICQGPEMPSLATVSRWLADEADTPFRRRYALACELRADLLGDELLEVADDSTGDYIETPDGRRVVDLENIARSALRIEDLWQPMGKLAAWKYGD